MLKPSLRQIFLFFIVPVTRRAQGYTRFVETYICM